MKCIFGLGNPGRQYAGTRHNAGFMVVERLAKRHGLTGVQSKFHSAILDGRIADQRCMLLQPQTYMNRSGLAVAEAAKFYNLSPADVLIVVDDVALPCGTIRLRGEGSAGGHNGLSDIEKALGTRQYPRLRIGIDSPGRAPQVDYVLGKFSPDQQRALEPALDAACDAIETWLSEGLEKAMSLYNRRAEETS
jgi:PTH1 family peptidyl-tRNA hydrolase